MRNNLVRRLVGIAMLTAIVVVLQLFGSAIHFGPFSISLVLVPVVIGAALFGPLAGAWLGFVFGVVVLISGDAAAFLGVNVVGTFITVLVKGTAAGLFAGLVYSLLKKRKILATLAAAIIAPIVNTGLFLVGCKIFFMNTINEWSRTAGFENAGAYMIVGLVGINFLVELAINAVLSPVIVKIIDIISKRFGTKEDNVKVDFN